MTDVRQSAYTDNGESLTVAARLISELKSDPERLDIVTGYIAPSAWQVLGEALERVRRTRILLGKDYQLAPPDTPRAEADIAELVAQAVRGESVPAVLPRPSDAATISVTLDFLRRDDVDVRVWTAGFLHAKAYVLTNTVGVGSANFTAGGLCANRELVAWREDRSVVDQLRQWFEALWDSPDAAEYKERLISALEQTTFGSHPYTPYDVLIRTLAARYGEERPPSLEAASFDLQWFQEDAVFRLIQMIEQPAHGALLADAVGLGKTYMAFGVIHHFLHSTPRGAGNGPPVVVIVPASLVDTWERLLRQIGLLWACTVMSLQSLDRDADVSPHFGARLVVVDEAHRLRGRGVWWHKVMELLTTGVPDKRVLLLTATPINIGIRDLIALLQVLTKNRRDVYRPAIADFEAYLKRVERGQTDPFPLLDRTTVRRSRSDILRDYDERLAAGLAKVAKPKLPDRTLFHQQYTYSTSTAVDVFAEFATALRTLRLAPYDLEPYRRGAAPPETDDGSPVHGANSMAALVAAGLLKRFESSLEAIRLSLRRLDIVLRRSADVLASDPPRLLDLGGSPRVRELIAEERSGDEDIGSDLDARWSEVVDQLPPIADIEEIDLPAVGAAIVHDRAALSRLLAILPPAADDGKTAAIRRLFAPAGRLHKRRTLLFSQFRDTAIYVHRSLADATWRAAAGVGPVALLHGGDEPCIRARVSATFDPDQAGDEAMRQLAGGDAPPQILVSTDVLAEGHNLQLAEAVVNLDLPWNPQVVVQRAGRIDRLGSPHRRVSIGSFVPEEGLEAHLGLMQALDRRFRLIHLLGMGDEPVMKLGGDVQRVTFEQMRSLLTDDVSVLDQIERSWTLGSTDFMRAPLEAYLNRHARDQLRKIPLGVQSVKALPSSGWDHGAGVFVALEHGGAKGVGGETFWRFYPREGDGWGTAVVDEAAMFRAIACREGERRPELSQPFPGPGGIIDWPLLRRAAEEVAGELTRRRATAAIQRGASETSRKVRQQLRDLFDVSGDVEGLSELLDRLEEVRLEDYDHDQRMRRFREKLLESRRATTAGERHDLLAETVARGLGVLGRPQGEAESEIDVVQPEDLRLVSWEVLVERVAPQPVDQLILDARSG